MIGNCWVSISTCLEAMLSNEHRGLVMNVLSRSRWDMYI